MSLFRLGTGSVTKLAEAVLAPNAHIVAVDPATHEVSFPLQNLDGKTALRIVKPLP